MRVSDAFPSKWLSAADLGGRNVQVVIDRVEMESVAKGEPPKPVLYFKGKNKGLVLNKTNAKTIAHEYGDDTDDWRDCEIVLFEVMTEFQGNPVEAIRVRRPTIKDRPQAGSGVGSPRQAVHTPEPPPHTDLPDDPIPF